MNSSKNDLQKLPDGWMLCKSKSIPGRTYYFNKKTGKSSWTQPQVDDKLDNKASKNDKLKKQGKKKCEEHLKKGAKRKSDSHEESTSKKRPKQGTPVKQGNTKRSISPEQFGKTETPKKASPHVGKSNLPDKKNEDKSRQSYSKNLASTRLAQLRASLALDIEKDKDKDESPSPHKRFKSSPKAGPCETPQKAKSEHKSPTLNDSRSTQSPSSESLQSIPSPSQFFAANKIISSMKAQLPDEYCNVNKPKDTFADIEKGIRNQVSDYPSLKHPATPPQFSEASKLVSAIKSKLTYKSTSRDIKNFSSAKDRMEALRANLSTDSETDLNESLSKKTNEFKSQVPLNRSVQLKTQISEAMDIEEFKELKQNVYPLKKDDSIAGGDLVLVVDTNIFIHDLDFIKNILNSHIEGYCEQPTLLVPWRVINELDRLKDNNNGNGALCKRAKAAMDYLYKSLPENKRIVGQSLRDANSHIYPCEIPDDEILNCSLQQVERGKNVLLLSNDKNLCNKAIINSVKHISVSDLKKMLVNRAQPTGSSFVTNIKHYQETMYQLLANILENEMRAKYNNLWQHVLFKVPPWSLADVLQCLLKHWIAVFNEVFPRIEHMLTDLRNTLVAIEKKDQNRLTESEVTNFKDLCVDVAKRCQIIPEYMELAKKTVERLSRNCASETDAPDNSVVQAFEALWTVLSSYCGQLCGALGVAHGLDVLPSTEPAAVLASRWSELSARAQELAQGISGVLSAENTNVEEQIQRLESGFNSALALLCGDSAVSRDQLRLFCTNNRNMLQEACTKFTQLVDLLNVCKNTLSSLN